MDDLNAITLNSIKRCVPRKLYLKLEHYNILTIGDILKTDDHTFKNLPGIGLATLELFNEFKRNILRDKEILLEESRKNQQKRILPNQEKNLFFYNEPLLGIDVLHLSSIIPSALMGKLIKFKMTKVKSILNVTESVFANMPTIGQKTVELFVNLREKIICDPESIYKIYLDSKKESNPKALPFEGEEIESQANTNLMDSFKQFLGNYFDLCKKESDRTVIYKRFGIKEGRRYRLEEIGDFYNRSREWTRKIQNKHFQNIKKLLTGETLHSPYCACERDIVLWIEKLNDLLRVKILHSKKNIDKLFLDELEIILDNESNPYLSLLLAVLGFEEFSYNDNVFYIYGKKIRKKAVELVLRAITDALEQKCGPISKFELGVQVNKLLKPKRVNESYIKNALDILREVETIMIEDQIYYQLKFEYLSSLKDMSYRILLEKNEPLSYQQIFREINHRLAQLGIKKRISIQSIPLQTYNDPRIVPVGRTGDWALKEWNVNTDTIINLIRQAFNYYNEPCSLITIFNHLKKERSSINRRSVEFYLNDGKGICLKTNDGKFILREWKSEYEEVLTKKNRYPKKATISESALRKKLIEIFTENDFKKMPTDALWNFLEKKGMNFRRGTLSLRLPKTKILHKEMIAGKNYYRLVDNYKDIAKDKELPKLKKIEQAIIDILEGTMDREFQLSEIRNKLLKNFGYTAASVYYVVSNSKAMSTTVNEGIKFVSLNTPNGDINGSLKPNGLDIMSVISSGENSTTEFKSSLRWDFRKKQINKELEYVVAKTISAFLNSEGGVLFIGVSDDGEIIGLQRDYKSLGKKNRDGFLLRLDEIIIAYLGKEINHYLKIEMVEIDSKEICSINITKSESPVYLINNGKSEFFIRASASTQSLDVRDVVQYIRTHWQNTSNGIP